MYDEYRRHAKKAEKWDWIIPAARPLAEFRRELAHVSRAAGSQFAVTKSSRFLRSGTHLANDHSA